MIVLSVSAWAQSPNTVVEEALVVLDQALADRGEELAADRQVLYTLIDDLLLPRFDRKYAAQLVLGRHWRKASAEQRTAFTDAFYQSLLRKYADGVLEFDQNKIKILKYRGDDSKKRTTVKTIVTLDNGTKVPVNYGLVRRDTGWLMFDVTIEGISYVRNFRAELNSEIQNTSLDAVIGRLNKDIGDDA